MRWNDLFLFAFKFWGDLLYFQESKAQLDEQRHIKPEVVGSIPTTFTKERVHFHSPHFLKYARKTIWRFRTNCYDETVWVRNPKTLSQKSVQIPT